MPGSYDVLLATQAPCLGADVSLARLDLEPTEDGGWRAVVAFEGQAPAAFAVTATPPTWQLDGLARGERSDPLAEATRREDWTHLTISHKTGANAGLSVHAEGQRSLFDGGDSECNQVPMVGDGVLTADATAPQGKLALARLPGRRGQVLLPWDPLTLALSEPLDPVALQGALSASATLGGASTPLAASWSPPVAGDEAVSPDALWAGTHQLLGQGPWPDGAQITLSLAPGVTDPGGHPLASQTLTATVTDVGPAIPSLELDTAPPGLWGDAVHLAASDRCESGGCVELGKSHDSCPPPLAGVSARLQVPAGASQLHLRVRVDVSGDWGQPHVFVELGAAGQPPASHALFAPGEL
ncbi:MAG: hypothetical protein EOO75_20260, partial [Myxococcales bacterium]